MGGQLYIHNEDNDMIEVGEDNWGKEYYSSQTISFREEEYWNRIDDRQQQQRKEKKQMKLI